MALQYSTVQYNTIQYSTIRYSTVQYDTVHYITRYVTPHPLRCITRPYLALPNIITLHHITLQYITLHCIILHYITLAASPSKPCTCLLSFLNFSLLPPPPVPPPPLPRATVIVVRRFVGGGVVVGASSSDVAGRALSVPLAPSAARIVGAFVGLSPRGPGRSGQVRARDTAAGLDQAPVGGGRLARALAALADERLGGRRRAADGRASHARALRRVRPAPRGRARRARPRRTADRAALPRRLDVRPGGRQPRAQDHARGASPPPPCPLVARRVVVWSSDAPRFEPFARRWGRAHIVIARHGPCVGTHPASRRRGGLG